MKRFSLLIIAALAVVFGAHAQEALWSRANVQSPQINDDNSVTFRLLAPQAQKVAVTGDFTTTEGKDIRYGEMSKNDKGVWEFTTPPLRSELYSRGASSFLRR